MAPSGLLFSKNDSGHNSIQNLRWWAFGNYWSLQKIATLPRRLQAQGARAYQSSLPSSLHGNIKPEFSSSLVSQKTLTVLFLNRLFPGHGKWRFRCTILFSSEKQGWRKKASGLEPSNSSLLAIFINKCHSIRSICVGQLIAPISSPHLQNLFSLTAALILELAPNRANQWGTLFGQQY